MAPELDDVASAILPGLWLSAMPRPDWPIERWGIRLLVSLSEHLPPHAARRFEWGTPAEATGDGQLIFLHWPFEDGDLPPWPLAQLASHTVATAVRSELPTLVHCMAGRNRSGLIAALVVRELLGVSGSEAVARVRARRTGALTNPAFAAALAALGPPAPAPPPQAGLEASGRARG